MKHVIWTVRGICVSTLEGFSASLVSNLAREFRSGGLALVILLPWLINSASTPLRIIEWRVSMYRYQSSKHKLGTTIDKKSLFLRLSNTNASHPITILPTVARP